MKNQRSQSQQLLRRVQEELTDKQNELMDLKDRIDRSKPILQTIYSKIKRKQELYVEKINKNSEIIAKQRTLLRQYRRLYEESVMFIKKGKLINQFAKQPSNYLINPLKKPKKPPNQPNKPPNHSSIYQQYKQRIDRRPAQESNEPIHNKSQNNLNSLRKQTKNLTQSIERHVNEIKQIRNKSHRRMKKSFSEASFMPAKTKKKNLNELKQVLWKKRSQQFSNIN